jgi:hypothetical protein
MFHGRGYSARCFLQVAVGSVGRSERATRSAPGRRRSADSELWRPCEPDVIMGPGRSREGASTFLKVDADGQPTDEVRSRSLPSPRLENF